MTRYIAFLRAINLGSSRAVKMEYLRKVFESLGFSEVSTFLASGNVLFETTARNTTRLERRIEKALQEALGYEVPTFIRTDAELEEIANFTPFRQSEIRAAAEINIIFLADRLDEKTRQDVNAFNKDTGDIFRVHRREIYWLRRKMQSGPAGSLQKVIGAPITFRSAQTVKRIAAKYASTKS